MFLVQEFLQQNQVMLFKHKGWNIMDLEMNKEHLMHVKLQFIQREFGAKISNLRQAPILIEKAIRQSCAGRPGVAYIVVSGELLKSNIPENELIKVPTFNLEQIPRNMADPQNILQAVQQLKNAKRQLELEQVQQKIKQLNLLNQQNCKGVVPDSNNLNVSAARLTALGEADVILLIGARLNWILHFGLPPRFNDNCQIILIVKF
ncbi:unnamed protein product [Paramecium sonneborni]|uniref:Thiamine pyrophosphate enzyme central domain-containing protein n=1 Tax=Paramecium sonneborni TaxID=65129 RepID=A0A8S1RUE8_9CILI|nr:unnamed protein product [Paramecium sonneborni]